MADTIPIRGVSGWSFAPLVSIFLGVYHVLSGTVALVGRVVGPIFVRCREKFGARPDCGERTAVWLQEENKKGIHRAVETIGLGILEIDQFVGKIGLYFSKWRCTSYIEREVEAGVAARIEEWKQQEEERVDRQVEARLKSLHEQYEIDTTPPEQGVVEESIGEGVADSADIAVLRSALTQANERIASLKKMLEDEREASKTNVGAARTKCAQLETRVHSLERRVRELRSQLKEQKTEEEKKLSSRVKHALSGLKGKERDPFS